MPRRVDTCFFPVWSKNLSSLAVSKVFKYFIGNEFIEGTVGRDFPRLISSITPLTYVFILYNFNVMKYPISPPVKAKSFELNNHVISTCAGQVL